MNQKEKLPKLYFLKLRIEKHPLFENDTTFSLVNDMRVDEDSMDQLTKLFGRVWINNVIALVGKNATGKTTVMKTLVGILSLLLAHQSIDQTLLKRVLVGTEPIKYSIYFYGEDHKVYEDRLVFDRNDDTRKWYIKDEIVLERKINNKYNKKTIFDFSDAELLINRHDLEGLAASILAPDDSLFRAAVVQQNYEVQYPIDTLAFTDVNALFYINEDVPGEILNFLDPTIEYLKIENKKDENGQVLLRYRLKFKNREEEIRETNFSNIEEYLSSGTARGITLYGSVITALKCGGIIFVDELENHFNHAIVRSFIEYFSDPRININRAVLVFSTHYSELLDDLKRGDGIYIAKRNKEISLQRYSSANVRSDLNRNDVFDSNYLGGTAPEYSAYKDLRNATKKAVLHE